MSPTPAQLLRATALALALLLAAPAAAAAAPPPAAAAPFPALALEVARDKGAAKCPDAAALQKRVVGRLARNPFEAGASRKVQVSFAKKKKVFSARLVIDPPPGSAKVGARDLISAKACDELADAVAIAIALTLGPELDAPLVARPRRPLDPTSGTARVVRREGPDEAKPAKPKLRWYLHAGLGAGFGLTPGPSMVARVGAGAGIAGWRATLSLVGDFLGRKDVDGVRVEGTIVAGELELCRDLHPVELCAVLLAGDSAFSGDGLTTPEPSSVGWVSLGPRVNVIWASNPSVALLFTADLDFPFVRTRFRVEDEVVWRTPVAAGTFTLGARIPL
ncbi:MAG: hypothetical protein H6745_25455 [Deltaproteobacteria bacterium]|nr:hypothetical protein [Deltaproteobacteria bacterium]